jgi:hypothetical protein
VDRYLSIPVNFLHKIQSHGVYKTKNILSAVNIYQWLSIGLQISNKYGSVTALKQWPNWTYVLEGASKCGAH